MATRPIGSPRCAPRRARYEHGEGVPRDPARAVELYCEAARLGDAEAQFSLGWMYANGRGMPRDNRMASLFFGMAAEQGHEYAQKMLALRRPGRRRPARMHARSGAAARSRRRRRTPRVEDEFVAVDAGAEEGGRDRAQARARIPDQPASSRSPSFAPSPTSIRTRARPKNAQGLMQLIPETSARFNVKKPFDPVQNVRGGLAYLRWLLAYFRGDVALVAAAYNAGEGTVERYRGIPPYAETRAYVQRIKRYFRKDQPSLRRDGHRSVARVAAHSRRERRARRSPCCLRRLAHRPHCRAPRWRSPCCCPAAGIAPACRRGCPRRSSASSRPSSPWAPSRRPRSPPFVFRGTGFAVDDGTLIATNAHVVPEALQTENRRNDDGPGARAGSAEPQAREAKAIAVDKEHDLALLRIAGAPLPVVTFGNSEAVRDGQSIAFTGFPIGNALGFYPVTHRGIIASQTPIAIPGATARAARRARHPEPEGRSVRRCSSSTRPPIPGHSGSPLYDAETGEVIGIVNMGFVKGDEGRGGRPTLGHQLRRAGAVPAGADPRSR